MNKQSSYHSETNIYIIFLVWDSNQNCKKYENAKKTKQPEFFFFSAGKTTQFVEAPVTLVGRNVAISDIFMHGPEKNMFVCMSTVKVFWQLKLT